jgi:hypothetical protein
MRFLRGPLVSRCAEGSDMTFDLPAVGESLDTYRPAFHTVSKLAWDTDVDIYVLAMSMHWARQMGEFTITDDLVRQAALLAAGRFW